MNETMKKNLIKKKANEKDKRHIITVRCVRLSKILNKNEVLELCKLIYLETIMKGI